MFEPNTDSHEEEEEVSVQGRLQVDAVEVLLLFSLTQGAQIAVLLLG